STSRISPSCRAAPGRWRWPITTPPMLRTSRSTRAWPRRRKASPPISTATSTRSALPDAVLLKEDLMPAASRQVVHPDIKPENAPALASHYLDVPNMPWEATKFPGIKIKVLYSDDSGITTALFKLEPGAVVPLHEHTALEQTYVIEGTIEDHEGVCGPGQFVWRPAGNQHEAVAPNLAVLL